MEHGSNLKDERGKPIKLTATKSKKRTVKPEGRRKDVGMKGKREMSKAQRANKGRGERGD